MHIDFDLWGKRYDDCREKALRICDLNKNNDPIKCDAALCILRNAMHDIQGFFKCSKNKKSIAELCFLIRNIDFAITEILTLNNILLGVGLNKSEKAIDRCFTNKNIILEFRILRSLILAHPTDTNCNYNGKSKIICYFEDIIPSNSVIAKLDERKKSNFIKSMRNPETGESYSESLSIKKDIKPVIETIIDSMYYLLNKLENQIISSESKFTERTLCLDNSTMKSYIISLDKELERRYPSVVENVEYINGTSSHYSIVYQCLLYFNAHFPKETQEKYDIFLEYITSELHKIESDLQQMQFNEDKYFRLLDNPNFAPDLSYAKSKMIYLQDSDEKSYTDDYININNSSNTLCGIKYFRDLMPFINKYIPVDVSVSDKELYCQYIAAEYLSTHHS